MIWCIYNIMSGIVSETLVDEPTIINDGFAKCKAQIPIGSESSYIIIIEEIDLETLDVIKVSMVLMSDKYKKINDTELEVLELKKRLEVTQKALDEIILKQ